MRREYRGEATLLTVGVTPIVVRTGATPAVFSGRGRHELCCPDGASRSDGISSSDDVSPTSVLEFETGATPDVLSGEGGTSYVVRMGALHVGGKIITTLQHLLHVEFYKMRGCGGKEHGCFGGVHGYFDCHILRICV